MQKVGEFEKVSFEQFYAAMKDEFEHYDQHGALITIDELFPPDSEVSIEKLYKKIRLPTRATMGSAGYDFKAPYSFELAPGETCRIPTGIRVDIKEGWWLGCFPRSGLGFKYRLQLDNTVGIIDSDYYYSDNEGHIFAKITNDSREGENVSIEAGSGFIQGVFLPYGITYSDGASGVRNGGMGSTEV